MPQDEGHYIGVVVFEEAKVRILGGYLVRKEGELSYLEELVHSKLTIRYLILNYSTHLLVDSLFLI